MGMGLDENRDPYFFIDTEAQSHFHFASQKETNIPYFRYGGIVIFAATLYREFLEIVFRDSL